MRVLPAQPTQTHSMPVHRPLHHRAATASLSRFGNPLRYGRRPECSYQKNSRRSLRDRLPLLLLISHHATVIDLIAIELVSRWKRTGQFADRLQRLQPSRVTLDLELPIAFYADLDLVAFL